MRKIAVALLPSLTTALIAAAPVRADVIYTFFDMNNPSQVDLSFSVATQLATNNQTEAMMDIGGFFASDFTGRSATYTQSPPGFQPNISIVSTFFGAQFTSFPFGDPANGAPGNGTFPIRGAIGSSNVGGPPTITDLGLATISGVPSSSVPEPASAALLGTALLLLGTVRWLKV